MHSSNRSSTRSASCDPPAKSSGTSSPAPALGDRLGRRGIARYGGNAIDEQSGGRGPDRGWWSSVLPHVSGPGGRPRRPQRSSARGAPSSGHRPRRDVGWRLPTSASPSRHPEAGGAALESICLHMGVDHQHVDLGVEPHVAGGERATSHIEGRLAAPHRRRVVWVVGWGARMRGGQRTWSPNMGLCPAIRAIAPRRV